MVKCIVFLCVFNIFSLFALSYSENQTIELIDSPTAGLHGRGNYFISLRMQPRGSIIASLSVGLMDRLSIGLSYGGQNIIGYGTPDWNPAVGVQIKYRIIDESFMGPAIALGFDSQGYGAYNRGPERYDIKSKGFYATASKNYIFLGRLGFHGGANYSLERDDGDKEVNFFAGLEKTLNPELSLIADYDFAFNDDKKDSLFGEGKGGYLNAGIRWTFASKAYIEFDLKNLLRNGKEGTDYARVSRIIKMSYIEHF